MSFTVSPESLNPHRVEPVAQPQVANNSGSRQSPWRGSLSAMPVGRLPAWVTRLVTQAGLLLDTPTRRIVR